MSSSSSSEADASTAPYACEPCKRRKKSCNKALPACARCSRLLVKCSYINIGDNRSKLPPPLLHAAPKTQGFGPSPPLSPPLSKENSGAGNKNTYGSIEAQVSSQAGNLLDDSSRRGGNWDLRCALEKYFETFNRALPIIERDVEGFCRRLENGNRDNDEEAATFRVLALSILLITRMAFLDQRAPVEREEKIGWGLYREVKGMYGLLRDVGKVTEEILQVGILIATYEYCQAMMSEAWITIGNCVRTGQMLGLHKLVKGSWPEVKGEWRGLEKKLCVWWAIVVFEWVINVGWQDGKLPCAAAPPALDDLLPLMPFKDNITHRIRDCMLLPEQVTYETQLQASSFTEFGPFASTVQSTYLSTLVTLHKSNNSRDSNPRRCDAVKLSAALQYFSTTLIPPPGQSVGGYCAAFSLLNIGSFDLNEHELEISYRQQSPEAISRALLTLQSVVRTVIFVTKAGHSGIYMDFDTLSCWSHRMVWKCALLHIRVGERNAEWRSDTRILVNYLRRFESRYKLYANYVREIEEAEAAALQC